MTTVTLPKEISALFADAHNNFPAIIGKHSNDDLQCLRHRNFAALQDIDLGDSTDATGLILSEDDHKAANRGHLFDQPDGTLEAYNPSIRDNDKNTVCLRQEKNGLASLIAKRPSKPPSAWERNSSSPVWKKRGWFALNMKPPSSSMLPSTISSTTLEH